MPDITLIHRPPVPELLRGVEQLLRTGLPPLLASPDWAVGDPAPAEHWLVQEGTRIFSYDTKEQVETPALIVSNIGKEMQEYPNSLAYWKIPIGVMLLMPSDPAANDILKLRAKYFRMFTESLPTGDPATITPWGRLNVACAASSTALGLPERAHVFTHGIDEVDVTGVEDKSGHPGVLLTLNIICGTATDLPAAA